MPIKEGTVIEGHESKPPIPEDVYQCQIVDVNLEEKPKYKNPDEKEQVFTFQFVVLEEGQYRGRKLFKDMRPIVTPPSNGMSSSTLYDFLKGMAGRELTKEECAGITPARINALISKQIRLTVGVTEKGKNKVTGFLKIKQEYPKYDGANTVPQPEEPPDDYEAPHPADDLPF